MSVYIRNDFQCHKTDEFLICSLNCAVDEEIKITKPCCIPFIIQQAFTDRECICTELRKGEGRSGLSDCFHS